MNFSKLAIRFFARFLYRSTTLTHLYNINTIFRFIYAARLSALRDAKSEVFRDDWVRQEGDGSFFDVVWYYLGVTRSTGFPHSQFTRIIITPDKTTALNFPWASFEMGYPTKVCIHVIVFSPGRNVVFTQPYKGKSKRTLSAQRLNRGRLNNSSRRKRGTVSGAL